MVTQLQRILADSQGNIKQGDTLSFMLAVAVQGRTLYMLERAREMDKELELEFPDLVEAKQPSGLTRILMSMYLCVSVGPVNVFERPSFLEEWRQLITNIEGGPENEAAIVHTLKDWKDYVVARDAKQNNLG